METPQKEPTKVPPRVTEIARRAELRGLNLLSSTCELVDARPGDKLTDLDVSLRGGVKRDSAASTLACAFGVDVGPKTAAPEGRVVARISCDYAVTYLISDKVFLDSLSQEDMEMFSALNGSFNIWPYVRELVTSLAQKMGLPPVLLPLFRPTQMIPNRDKWGPHPPEELGPK